MKICYLNYAGGPTTEATDNRLIGGLNTILFNLAKQVSLSPDVKVEVVFRNDGCSEEDHSLREIKLAAGQPIILSRLELENHLSEFIVSVREYLLASKPDLVHTSGSEAGKTMSELRRQGLVIPWVHTNYATIAVRQAVVGSQRHAESKTITERENECLLNCDGIIALSESDRAEIATVFKIDPRKIIVVQPGIDHSIFWPNRKARPGQIILSAGRMSQIKDWPFLLRSFSLVKKSIGSDPRLVIIGGQASERSALGLPALVEELGISREVDFINGVSQIVLANYFRVARVFAAPSQHETFGLLPVEARACGTPFVARANSGYLATAQDGCGGYFCDNNSVSDMAAKILLILNLEEEAWQALSRQAVESTFQYQWSTAAQESLFIYQEVIKDRRNQKK